MAAPVKLEIVAQDGAARRGHLVTPHGTVPTPAFMPVGTQAAVKAMAPGELWDIGYRMVLANAYHLAVRPGPDLICEMGGIQAFMGWRGAVLTDSGGFQAMSLATINRITEEGIRFRSHLDGSPMMLTPESSLEIQQKLGCDIMMALDECTPYPAEPAYARRSLELTARWAERSLRARTSGSQALFGIVQGSVYSDLRAASARQITSLGFDGFATGGLSVGEPKPLMLEMAELSASLLPPDKPRYLMGVGTPADLLAAIAMGYDMFDCVLPTRNARNGCAFTGAGRISIKHSRYARDSRPLDECCECRTCTSYSRSYLRHLYRAGEILAARALTEHNLFFYAKLMDMARAAITSGSYEELRRSLTPETGESADAINLDETEED
jgi:queuine tRNA-ribosyltransferase